MNLKELREKILYFNTEYEKGKPVVSDFVYDFYKKQLAILEENEQIKISDQVGAVIKSENKKQHLSKILSLEHDFGKKSFIKFLKKIEKKVDPFPLAAEVKIDGVSLIARYEKGNLEKLATRGDGEFGEDITHLKSKLRLPEKIEIQETIEIRFEAYMEKNIIKNPRNAVAGMLLSKQFNPNLKFIRFAPHNLYSQEFSWRTYEELRETFRALHLEPIEPFQLCNNLEELEGFFDRIEKIKDELASEIDGVVFKVNDFEKQAQLGDTAKAPRHSFAVKFENSFAITQIEKIEFQVGRFGRIIPVASLKETEIRGRKISKATLNNFNELKKKGYSEGDIVQIEMAGEVIPMITTIIEKSPNELCLPTQCPSCKSELNYDICEKNWDCPEQKLQRLFYFASKKGLDIENMGIKQIEFFINEGILTYPFNFFEIENNINKIRNNPSWLAQKSFNNIITSIEKSRHTTLKRFYTSLGLPHLGENKTHLLEKEFGDFERFINATQEEFEFLGPTNAKNLYEFKEKEKDWIIKTFKYMKIGETYNEALPLFDF
jgi:DNA ligase (NAD+)